MPISAALPVPTMMATGVARPKAQGQEITSTEMALDRANSKDVYKRQVNASVGQILQEI